MGEKSCENCRKYNEDDPDATPCLHSNCGPSNDYEDWQPRSEVEVDWKTHHRSRQQGIR